ncbi:MAG: hypothetical protein IKP95_09305 [Ruminococcus sp.]|nr:hypothetical protein [Ruminococcus sp.]
MYSKTPMFVFNREAYNINLSYLKNAFKQRMDGFKVGYSFKTNPHPLVLKAALENGMYAEVVSPYEYSKAIEAGFTPNRIIYNGVCKDMTQAYFCSASGGIVNVDSTVELVELDKHSSGELNIGVRLSFEVGKSPISRFGIPIQSKDFEALLDIDRHNSRVHIRGLSCHLTHARSADEWRLRANIMANAARQFKDVKYIDLGGNMYSPMDCGYSANFPGHVSFDEYAAAICPELADFDGDLILETGTPLIANAVDLRCNVTAIKKNKDKTFIVVDASSYDIGIVCRHTHLTYDVEHNQYSWNSSFAEIEDDSKATVVGYTCIEDDVICTDFKAPVSVGDTIVFHNVGAYSVSFASDFIMPKIGLVERKD